MQQPDCVLKSLALSLSLIWLVFVQYLFDGYNNVFVTLLWPSTLFLTLFLTVKLPHPPSTSWHAVPFQWTKDDEGTQFLIVWNVKNLSILVIHSHLSLSSSPCPLSFFRVEFQNKFYSGQGFKFVPFSFESILEGRFDEWWTSSLRTCLYAWQSAACFPL